MSLKTFTSIPKNISAAGNKMRSISKDEFYYNIEVENELVVFKY